MKSAKLENAFTVRVVAGEQEGLNQFAFAAGDHPWKPLIPFTLRDFGLTVQPP